SRIHMPIREGRMRPNNVAAGGGAGRCEQVRAADLFVAFGTEFGDDQIAFFIGQKEPVSIFYDEGIGPADRLAIRRGLKRFPNAFTSLSFQAAKLSVTADSIDVAIFEEGSAKDGV